MADSYRSIAADVASGTAAKTILQIVTPSTVRALLEALELSFDGVLASATPVLVELLMQTDAGTGGTAVTPVAVDRAGPASLVTAQKGPAGTWTAEPAAGTVLWSHRVTPAGSTLLFPFPLGFGFKLNISQRLGVRVTAAATVNVCATLQHQE